MINLKYYPTVENMKKLWSALGSLQKSNSVNEPFTPATAQANSTATDVAGLVADFNSLLTKLRAAGIINS